MHKDNMPLWLDIVIGIIAAILCSIGGVLLLGVIGLDYGIPVVIGVLSGAGGIGTALVLFFALRVLARMGYRRTGLKGFALDLAIALVVSIIWAIDIIMLFEEGDKHFIIRLVRQTLIAAVMLGITLGLFIGLRALASKLRLAPRGDYGAG